MPETSASLNIPKNNTNRFIDFINKLENKKLLLFGVGLYVLPIVVISVVMSIFANNGHNVLLNQCNYVKDFFEIVYFNFITILTVGYGDITPIGIFRLLAVFEALYGVAILGLIIGVVIIKITNPSLDSIVFSRYCFYAKNEKSFL